MSSLLYTYLKMEIKIEFFSQQIRNLREAKSLTQEELAHELGISRQSIISLERGKCLPSLPLAFSLADIFDLTLENFFYPEEENRNDGHVELVPQNLVLISSADDVIDDSIENEFEDTSWPAVNMYENNDEVVVEAEVPGMAENDLQIEISEEYLTIKGSRNINNDDKKFFTNEFTSGSFSRKVNFPVKIDRNKAEAELKNGILKIVLPCLTVVTQVPIKIKINKK